MRRPDRSNPTVPTPIGPLEVRQVGSGEPASLFVHGLAGSIATTRPYATGVRGTRTFVHLPGHGRSPVPDRWRYDDLGLGVLAVADAVGADRALGVSMGAGALCALLARHPDRFSRVVLALPAVIDAPRPPDPGLLALAENLESGDLDGVARVLREDQPRAVRDDPAVQRWCREQAERCLAEAEGLAAAVRAAPGLTAVPDREALRAVTCPVLVLAQEGDPRHPVAVARELAGLFPGGVLTTFGPGGMMFEHRHDTRDLVGEFLSRTTDLPGRPCP